jgi:hypothetical protein
VIKSGEAVSSRPAKTTTKRPVWEKEARFHRPLHPEFRPHFPARSKIRVLRTSPNLTFADYAGESHFS